MLHKNKTSINMHIYLLKTKFSRVFLGDFFKSIFFIWVVLKKFSNSSIFVLVLTKKYFVIIWLGWTKSFAVWYVLIFVIRPTSVRVWHKAVFQVGPVAGSKPRHVRQFQKCLGPHRLSPFLERLRRPAINLTPPRRVKAWEDGPLRPEAVLGAIVKDPVDCKAVLGTIVKDPVDCEAVLGAIVADPVDCKAVLGAIVADPADCEAVLGAIVADPADCKAVLGAIVADPADCEAVLGAIVADPVDCEAVLGAIVTDPVRSTKEVEDISSARMVRHLHDRINPPGTAELCLTIPTYHKTFDPRQYISSLKKFHRT